MKSPTLISEIKEHSRELSDRSIYLHTDIVGIVKVGKHRYRGDGDDRTSKRYSYNRSVLVG